jgi:hypothetical protein
MAKQAWEGRVLDDVETAKGLWGLLISGAMFVLGLSAKRTLGRVDKIEARGNENHDDLKDFKTEVAKDYAKEASMQLSLARIHDRMDDMVDKATVLKLSNDIGQLRTELQSDIKSILRAVGENGRTKTAN